MVGMKVSLKSHSFHSRIISRWDADSAPPQRRRPDAADAVGKLLAHGYIVHQRVEGGHIRSDPAGPRLHRASGLAGRLRCRGRSRCLPLVRWRWACWYPSRFPLKRRFANDSRKLAPLRLQADSYTIGYTQGRIRIAQDGRNRFAGALPLPVPTSSWMACWRAATVVGFRVPGCPVL